MIHDEDLSVGQATVNVEDLAGNKGAAGAGQEQNGIGALLGGAVALDVLVVTEALGVRVVLGEDKVSLNGTEQGHVDIDALGGKVLGPATGHGVQSSLGATVEVAGGNTEAGHNGRNVDDAGTGRGQVLLGGLDQQEDAADVDVEDGVKVLRGERGQVRLGGEHGGIVDENVNGAAGEGSRGGSDDVSAEGGAAGISLDGNGLDTDSLEGSDVLEGSVLAGVVVDDDISAMLSESQGSGEADTVGLAGAGDNGKLSLERSRHFEFEGG